MSVPSSPLPIIGGTNTTEDPKIRTALQELQTILTGAAGPENFSAALAALLGLTNGSTVRRGKSIVPTEESRTNTAYGLMSTPDRVSGVVLPTDGLICVAYRATWKSSVNAAGRAAIFIGANQLKSRAIGVPSPATVEAGNHETDAFEPLSCGPIGLVCAGNGNGGVYAGDVTTGQVLGTIGTTGSDLYNDVNTWTWNAPGGVCLIEAAAGTYDVGVQFKSSSGSVTAKNRKLWVWTMGF